MEKIPQHLGIILDGNRRWAKERGVPSKKGHEKGVERVKETIKNSFKKGVKILTLFVFSTENWKRPKGEITNLMGLAENFIERLLNNEDGFLDKDIKVKILGIRKNLPKKLIKLIDELEEKTKSNKKMIVNIALSYGGRAEIVEAVKNIINKKISPDKITEKLFADNLWTSDIDLVIRTGKEQRISNFFIWQTAYSELYFTKKYWPDFTEKDFKKAFEEFSNRKRRKGK